MTECSYKTVQRSANVFGEDDDIQRGINSVSEASDRTISPRHVQQHSQPDFPMLPSYRWFRISKHGTVVRNGDKYYVCAGTTNRVTSI